MGVSAVGNRGIKPKNIPLIFWGALAVIVGVLYLVGPALTPGLRDAAKEECNELTGSNWRSFRLDWKLPSSPGWDLPHWSCRDMRDPDRNAVDLGWWTNPF